MKNIITNILGSVLILFIFIYDAKVYSQSNIENTLKEISGNNKSLTANFQFLKSKRIESKIGNSLYNPFVEITNLFGADGNNGDQTEIKVIQSFDFPTSYSKRNKVADLKIRQTDFEMDIFRQNILMEAKLTCIELIYLNKKKSLLKNRIESMELLYKVFQIKLEKGEGNILDLNKSKINLLNSNSDQLILENRINELNQKLTELNGGNKIGFSDTLYPVTPVIPEFSNLMTNIEEEDPLKKSLIQEKLIYQGQIELSKSLNLPKFELGYYYLGLSTQKFNGLHLGFSLPLWENNHRTDFYKSKSLYSNLEIESYRNESYHEIKTQYNRYETLKNALSEYRTVLESIKSEELLLNALNIGEITILEYFIEIGYYNSSIDKLLELEFNFNKVIAELYKYQL